MGERGDFSRCPAHPEQYQFKHECPSPGERDRRRVKEVGREGVPRFMPGTGLMAETSAGADMRRSRRSKRSSSRRFQPTSDFTSPPVRPSLRDGLSRAQGPRRERAGEKRRSSCSERRAGVGLAAVEPASSAGGDAWLACASSEEKTRDLQSVSLHEVAITTSARICAKPSRTGAAHRLSLD